MHTQAFPLGFKLATRQLNLPAHDHGLCLANLQVAWPTQFFSEQLNGY